MENNPFRCNKCAKEMKNGQTAFSMTQCGHLFCHKCMKKGGNNCPVCNATGVQSVVLNEPLPPAVANIFVPCLEHISRTETAFKFFVGQHDILNRQYTSLEQKYEASKRAYWELLQHLKKLNEENAKYKEIVSLPQQSPVFPRRVPGSGNLPRNFNQIPMEGFSDRSNRQNIFTTKPTNFFESPGVPHHPNCANELSNLRGCQTPDSDGSGATIRNRNSARPLVTADGFRVPTSTRVPRSAGTFSNSSSESRTSPFSGYKNYGNSKYFRKS